jgi:hypothetical protein
MTPETETKPALVARIIETDGSVFVATEWSYEDDLGGYLCTGAFAGEQNRVVTAVIMHRSVRRIVIEEGA